MTRAHDNTDKKFGTAIRLARKKHKLTQMQLGEALGVTFQQIQKYKKGTNAVTSTRISELCRVDDLFDFRGRSAQPTQITLYDFSFLSRPGNAKLAGRIDDSVGLKQDDPVVRYDVIGVNGYQIGDFLEESHSSAFRDPCRT